MAPDEDDLLPIELPEPEDPEAKRAEMAAEHAEVIDELSVETPEIADHPAMSPVADAASIPAETLDDSIDEPKRKRGRYYVPPKDRTPANRADRRAEHDRLMRQMSQDGPPPVADNLAAHFARLDKEGKLDADGGLPPMLAKPPPGPSEEAVRNFMDADLQHRNVMTDMYLDMAEQIRELSALAEFSRL